MRARACGPSSSSSGCTRIPNLTNAALNPPAVNPKLDRHHLKGEVTTWAGLTGTWATARTYGDRILEIYAEILAWLTDRADI